MYKKGNNKGSRIFYGQSGLTTQYRLFCYLYYFLYYFRNLYYKKIFVASVIKHLKRVPCLAHSLTLYPFIAVDKWPTKMFNISSKCEMSLFHNP